MKTKRPEDITKMLQLEVETKAEEAAKLFDEFTLETMLNLAKNAKQAFILGYLHGQEKLMDDMGMFDDIDDDSKIYEFLQNNPDKFKRSK